VYLGGGDFVATYTKIIFALSGVLNDLRDGTVSKEAAEARLNTVWVDTSHLLVKALDVATRSSYGSFHHIKRIRRRYDDSASKRLKAIEEPSSVKSE
jgi:1,2-phenylacetyl-CoA epoxidase catalytic subunit